MKRKALSVVSMILSVFLCLGVLSTTASAEGEDDKKPAASNTATIEERKADDIYYADRVRELTSILRGNQDSITFEPSDITVLSSDDIWDAIPSSDSFGYGKDVLKIAPSSTLEFEVDVPKAGGYHIALDYYVPGNKLQDLEIAIGINGVYQYNDSKSIKLPVAWKDMSQDYKMDQYGNQIYPLSERVYRWNTQVLNSSMYYIKTPFIFELKEGRNRISITSNEVEYLLGAIHFLGKQEYESYENYKQKFNDKPVADEKTIIIEGEKYSEKSHAHIRGARSKNYDFTPYSAKDNLINNLAPTMWMDAGESVTYTFDVASSGLYKIALKYQQSVKDDMPVYKNIYIDGEVLFDELMDYPFGYTGTKNKNEILSADGENISFYLEKGTHTITLQSTASVYFEVYESLLQVVRKMNNISLDIKMITGNKIDKNRDWNILEYMPNLKEQLLALVDELNLDYDKLSKLSGKNNVSAIANIKVASDNILKYTVDKGNKKGLDTLLNNLDHFSQGNGSITEYISSVLTVLLDQPLTIDRIYVTSEQDKLPKANMNFVKAGFEELKKLVVSFTTHYDNSFSTDDKKLNIWVNRPVTHIEVLRELISSEYKSKGVEVNLSAMPDENRLLLAVAAGDAPDAVLGVSITKPFDMALRNAIYNLREFNDFGTVMKDFTPDMFVPFVLDDKCYAIPETASFYVQFYRTDIINKLGISIPKTWDDLIKVLPVLDRYGMNVNTIIAGADAFKHFGTTVPFIQQYEGKLYSDDGTSVAFDNPQTLKAFTLMTDLYTRYNMPERIVNFYNNFKAGVTPLGVSGLQTYILLKNAAPEIFGQWAIAPNIGRINEKGEFLNSQPDVETSSVIMNQSNKKEQAWDFIKWWMDADTQLQFGTDLQRRFGKEFVWNTANLTALSNYTYFSSDEKKIILDQMRAAQEIPRHPAYFQVEREMSNAWNKVVFDGVSVREALDKSALSANRVIAKKLKEFGYMTETGEIKKEFKVASVEEIASWGEE